MAGTSGSGSRSHSFHQTTHWMTKLELVAGRFSVTSRGTASAYTSRWPALISWPAWGRVPHPAPLSAQDV